MTDHFSPANTPYQTRAPQPPNYPESCPFVCHSLCFLLSPDLFLQAFQAAWHVEARFYRQSSPSDIYPSIEDQQILRTLLLSLIFRAEEEGRSSDTDHKNGKVDLHAINGGEAIAYWSSSSQLWLT